MSTDRASVESTQLAKERTRAATDRTLLAWIRTSLSLIGFGFGLAKSREVLANAGLLQIERPLHSLIVLGASFVALGLLCLIGASVQHVLIERRIRSASFRFVGFRPLALVVTTVLVGIGVYALVTIAHSH
jgi:putative membrane protein